MKKFLFLLSLSFFCTAGFSQSVPDGFWYAPDSISNHRLVFAADSLFLLKEITLTQKEEHAWSELEGIVMIFDSAHVFRACADYRQQFGKLEGEEGLYIYEVGCTDQKYRTISWVFDPLEGITLTLVPHSREITPSTLFYSVEFPAAGTMVLRKK